LMFSILLRMCSWSLKWELHLVSLAIGILADRLYAKWLDLCEREQTAFALLSVACILRYAVSSSYPSRTTSWSWWAEHPNHPSYFNSRGVQSCKYASSWSSSSIATTLTSSSSQISWVGWATISGTDTHVSY
jgi:hypothetical protein